MALAVGKDVLMPAPNCGEFQESTVGLQEPPAASLEKVLEALQGLHTREADGLPKRHQPLALLWAIGRARQGQDRLAPWPDAQTQIDRLITAYGRPTDRANAYAPFLALAHTDLWELTAEPPPKAPVPTPGGRGWPAPRPRSRAASHHTSTP
jgi:hypothetical protein